MSKPKKISISHFIWDLWCIVSIVGIWPRFIEPNLLSITKLKLPVSKLEPSLDAFKIVQFSDLHLSDATSDAFLERLTAKILGESPDLIVFTGDFLCFSKLESEKLKRFLNRLKAPFGCFAILGNHDYAQFVSINTNGEYDVIESSKSTIIKGFKRLFSSVTLKKQMTPAVKAVKPHAALENLLKETPFKLLHNTHEILNVNGVNLNLIGLGEYCLGKCLPEVAFKTVDPTQFSLVLSHNPDSLSLLKDYPCSLILSGHTHGGQVNLPWLKKKFMLTENPRLVRGLLTEENKKIYINRGVGSVMKFRWFSRPEILSLTLRKAK